MILLKERLTIDPCTLSCMMKSSSDYCHPHRLRDYRCCRRHCNWACWQQHQLQLRCLPLSVALLIQDNSSAIESSVASKVQQTSQLCNRKVNRIYKMFTLCCCFYPKQYITFFVIFLFCKSTFMLYPLPHVSALSNNRINRMLSLSSKMPSSSSSFFSHYDDFIDTTTIGNTRIKTTTKPTVLEDETTTRNMFEKSIQNNPKQQPYETDLHSSSSSALLSRRTAVIGSVSSIAATTGSYRNGNSGIANAIESTTTTTNSNVVTISKSNTGVVPTAQLGKSSLFVSRTIQGYWQLAGGHGRYQENDAVSNMIAHYNAGMTTLDTADIYGPSEIIIGKFMKQQPNAIPNTKFCCFRFLEDITRSEVKERILRSCERLQVQQLPLVQFFWSNYDVKRYVDVALYLTELKEQGYIKEIGATNFDLKRLKEMKKHDVPLVAHQVQLSALDRRPVQSGMADWCYDNDISLIAFGTVGSGILSNRWLGKSSPPTAEDRNTASMRLYSTTASRFGDWKLVQELLQTMNTIAKNIHDEGRCIDCNISNVAQRFVLDGTTMSTPTTTTKPSSSVVASVLIGVRNQDHIVENVRTHSFVLKQDEIDTINAVVAKRKGPVGDVWDLERG